MKVRMEVDVSETQHANLLEVANKKGMSAKAFLRFLIAEAGKDADLIRQEKQQNGQTNK
ncbi:TPA: hypothetical protein RFV54_003719 [Klebsiella aerogenes]|nr:hypothetical protein [Klebsiella aerogenes]